MPSFGLETILTFNTAAHVEWFQGYGNGDAEFQCAIARCHQTAVFLFVLVVGLGRKPSDHLFILAMTPDCLSDLNIDI